MGVRPFFSIVMPTYNVERYIADAVADILCQTFSDFELILVDDATPDASVEIAADLSKGDSRVRIVHHEQNKGLSEARNTGIQTAVGQWILFPDPDDRYDAHMLDGIAQGLEKHHPDLLVFGHTQEYYNEQGAFLYSNPLRLYDALFTTKEDIGYEALALEKETHLGYAWNKAYNLDVIRMHDLRFETVPFIEDIVFNLAYLKTVERLAVTDIAPYKYAKRVAGNLTNAYRSDYFDVHRRRIAEVRKMLVQRGCWNEQTRAVLGSLFARYIFSALERNCSKEAHMDRALQSVWLDMVFADPLFQEIIPQAHADESRALALCLKPLQAENKTALLALAQGIHVVRNSSTTLYTKVRSKR